MDGVTQIVFAPLVDWAIIITLGGAGAVVAAYAAWQGARGWGLRTLAMAALIALLANPSIREEKREPLSDIAVVVVDESPSQNIGPRREHAEAALNHIKKMTERDSLLEIRVVRAGKPRAISKNDAGAATQIPKDRGTRLFEALSRVMGDIPPDRFAGAVMITDGQVHDVPKSATTLPFPAPLHTVLTGTRNVNDRRLVVERAAGFGIVNEAVTLTLRIEESG
ncbi:MAG: hypothetical protein HN658_03165, partial [Rhodospirillales bacterium]|nr:hypothetical protein [Rhodospirillales bacterium]